MGTVATVNTRRPRSAARRSLFALRYWPDRRRLRVRHPGQAERFHVLAKDFARHYSHFQRYGARLRPYVTPFWERMNAQLECVLLPRPPLDFLNDATVTATMFLSEGGPIMDRQLTFLEKELPPDTLRRVVQEDHVGGPPIRSHKYQASSAGVRHLDLIVRYLRATNSSLDELGTVVEWGGGYGNVAKLIARLKGAPLTYVILDTPIIACLQWLYLGSIFGADRVHLVASPGDPILPGRFNLVNVAFAADLKVMPDLFVSTWALSESSAHAQRVVAERDWFGARRLLLAYHRSDSPVASLFESHLSEAVAMSGAIVESGGDMHPVDDYAFR